MHKIIKKKFEAETNDVQVYNLEIYSVENEK